jgi:3,4-dihydroxy 2-butanone 4-phosphate synthase/GTP cyclohydrolase II
MPDLVKFSQKHQLKIGTIADLIEYRRHNDKLVEKILESDFPPLKDFRIAIYHSKIDNSEHLALIKGHFDKNETITVRMHHLNIFDDILSNNKGKLHKSIDKISKLEKGAIIIIRQQNQSLVNLLKPKDNKKQSKLRNYGIGAQILVDLGIKNMILLTNSKKSVIGLEGYGLKICGYDDIL